LVQGRASPKKRRKKSVGTRGFEVSVRGLLLTSSLRCVEGCCLKMGEEKGKQKKKQIKKHRGGL